MGFETMSILNCISLVYNNKPIPMGFEISFCIVAFS